MGVTVVAKKEKENRLGTRNHASVRGYLKSPKEMKLLLSALVCLFSLPCFAQHEPPERIALPDYLEPQSIGDSSLSLLRITGDPGELIPNLDARWSEVARHGYSKEPAWNADQSLLLLRTHHGFPQFLFLDGNTFQPAFGHNIAPGSEMRWHPTRADVLFFVNGNQLGFWNPRENSTVIVATFDNYSELNIGPWEGNLSNNGKIVALAATGETGTVAFAYDLESRKKYPDIGIQKESLDWVSISASGKFIVAHGNFTGEHRDQTQVYDLEGKLVAAPWLSYGRPSHFDLAIDENGDDVAVGVSKSAPDEGRVIKRRLRDGEVTVLTEGGYAGHTSTRNLDRPGWAYVTYQYRGDDWPLFQDEVIAVKLDGSLTVERIAHLRTNSTDYLTQAHATPSPDGSMVIWASNWEAESGRPVGAYIVKPEK